MASSTYRPESSNDDLQQNVSEAQWVDYNLDGLATTTVGSLVPTVFDAYARVLYPVRASTTQHASSKTVAAWRDQLESISTVLTPHTTTPDECWFALWEGNTALDDIRATAPTAAVAGYSYFLFEGTGLTRSGHTAGIVTESVVAQRSHMVRGSALRLPLRVPRRQRRNRRRHSRAHLHRIHASPRRPDCHCGPRREQLAIRRNGLDRRSFPSSSETLWH